MVNKNYLIAFDFDGTVAKTYEKSPKGIGINEANRLAINDIFGQKGLDIFDNLGGLKNKAPSELIRNIIISGGRTLLDYAQTFFNHNFDHLNQFVPSEKSVPLVWNYEILDKVISELFVRQKLHYLMDQIGTQFPDGSVWPGPCKGFIEFWQYLQLLNKEIGGLIRTAIISSGHDYFIKKVFRTWSISLPDILVTEDDIRGRKYPKDIERRVKPGELPLALAHQEWLRMNNLTGFHFNVIDAKLTRDKILYFGDDLIKDGSLAYRAYIVFGLFTQEGKINQQFNTNSFSDWEIIVKHLQKWKNKMLEGYSFNEILSNNITINRRERC